VTPVVLKLGGSLAETGRLHAVLAILRRARRPLVVVPGGGPFAEAVREAQADLGFSDATAHDMALLAMHQMADVMIDLEPRLVAADTLVAMARAWRRRRIPVWLPTRLCAGDRRIPRDWSITSDGLAARLAERLGDVELVLVKSCDVGPRATPRSLARQGVVDPAFAAIVERSDIVWRVVGPGDEADLADLLDASRGAPARLPARRRRPVRSTPRRIHGRAVA
jgi:aspartokinase-like uncharacterized kinase